MELNIAYNKKSSDRTLATYAPPGFLGRVGQLLVLFLLVLVFSTPSFAENDLVTFSAGTTNGIPDRIYDLEQLMNHPMLNFVTKKSATGEVSSAKDFERDATMVEFALEDLLKESQAYPLRRAQMQKLLELLIGYLDVAELVNQGEDTGDGQTGRVFNKERLSTRIVREVMMMLSLAPINEVSSFHIAILNESLKGLIKAQRENKTQENRRTADFSTDEDVAFANEFSSDIVLSIRQAREAETGEIIEVTVEDEGSGSFVVSSRKHVIDQFADLNREIIDIDDTGAASAEFGPYRYNRTAADRVGIQEYVAIQGKQTAQGAFSVLSSVMGAEKAQSIFGWMNAVNSNQDEVVDLDEDPALAKSVVEAIVSASANNAVEGLSAGLEKVEGRIDPHGYFREIAYRLSDDELRPEFLAKLGVAGGLLLSRSGQAAKQIAGLQIDENGERPAVEVALTLIDLGGSLVTGGKVDDAGNMVEEIALDVGDAIAERTERVRDALQDFSESDAGQAVKSVFGGLRSRIKRGMERTASKMAEVNSSSATETTSPLAITGPTSLPVSCEQAF